MAWNTKLARPIPVIGGPTLRTLFDVRRFILGMPEGDQLRQSWQHAAALVLEAAGENGDIPAATRQVELALFMQARWLG